MLLFPLFSTVQLAEEGESKRGLSLVTTVTTHPSKTESRGTRTAKEGSLQSDLPETHEGS